MRYLFVLCVIAAFGFGLLVPVASHGQDKDKDKIDPEKVLAAALKNVKQKDHVDLRIQALMDLADFGPRAAPAMPDLLDALQTNNEDLRLNAAIVLGKIGKEAVAPVAKLLTVKDADTRFYAVWAISGMGKDAKSTTPTLIKLMADKHEQVRRKAAFALGRVAGDADATIEVLVKAFKDESEEVREAAGDALAKVGKKAVPSLIEILKEDNPKSRMSASTALGEIGSDAKDAVPLLRDLYLGKNSDNVYHYALMLSKIGKTAMPALQAGFKDSRAEVRQAASQALQQAGADAVDVLVDALGDKNVEVRRLAAQTLWPMNIGDKSVVIALAYGLSDPDEQVRQMCINGLQQLGPQAKLGAAKIREALTDMNPNVRTQAYYLMQTIGEDMNKVLTTALASKDAKIRINTACLIVVVGDARTKDAMPILHDALANAELEFKMQAAFTLAQRQLDTDKVSAIFVDGLKHKTPGVRIQAIQGLGMMRNAGPSVAPKLAEALRDPDANVRQQAVYALHGVRGAAETMSPILAKTYRDGDADIRRSVLQVAWMYGASSKDIVFDGLKDKDAGVRQQAINALQNLQGDLTDALPMIVTLLKDKETVSYRPQIVGLLTRVGDKGIPLLGDLLEDPSEHVRVQAIQVLRNSGDKAKPALPKIREAVKDKNWNIRLNALIMVAYLDNDATLLIKYFEEEKDANLRTNLLQNLTFSGQQKQVLPLLPKAMKDPSPQVRQATVHLIGHFNQDSKESFAIFVEGIKDSDNNVRIAAANHAGYFREKSYPHLEDALKTAKASDFRQAILQHLVNGQYKSKTAIPALIDCLKDSNLVVKQWSCAILGTIGPDAKDALPRLREVAKDANPNIQQAAQNAIRQIEAK